MNFSRVEWQYELDANGRYSRKKGENGKYLPEDNWVWTPCGQIAMHMPERWGYMYLSDKRVGQGTDTFRIPKASLCNASCGCCSMHRRNGMPKTNLTIKVCPNSI
uniref:CAZy families CBM9 protein n=1 Tax=uncultured Flavobacterium sp. TaxID=165435 RepID=A0A060CBJ2_9FLAO|nr:CAZy families CBM9 protein [uncultured Flavobacterium sp.]